MEANMSKPNEAKTKRTNKRVKPRPATKSENIIKLLKRPSGATMAELQKATGWQPHSVRGFLSGTLKKQMGLNVISEKVEDGERRYRIDEKVDA
jgi:hypothetical protein